MEKFGHILFYSKDAEHGWLSNFYMAKITICGVEWPSVEHYYQAMKSSDPRIQEWIRLCPKPLLAKKAGGMLRPEDGFDAASWETKKLEVMRTGLMAKFTQYPHLKGLLLATNTKPLHEDAGLNDTYWGGNILTDVYDHPSEVFVLGQDHLGILLCEVRRILKNE